MKRDSTGRFRRTTLADRQLEVALEDTHELRMVLKVAVARADALDAQVRQLGEQTKHLTELLQSTHLATAWMFLPRGLRLKINQVLENRWPTLVRTEGP